MENIFIIAAVISIIFLIAKFLEMRLVDKESKPAKLLVRDALLVYFSVISGYFILEQLKSTSQAAGSNSTVTPVFTGNPGF